MSQTESIAEAPVELLAVEDSPTQRELVAYLLQQHGFRVRTAGHGKEALVALQSFKPAAILTDILMPEMDGFELCRRIKAEPGLQDIPVVLLTALSDPKDVIHGLECGADGFIVKPYDEAYLLSRLAYVLSNRPLRQPERLPEGVEIVFGGRAYTIHAQRRQILDLLLSTYEAASRKHAELAKAEEKLKAANAALERKVRERTVKLQEANQSLESFCYTIAHDLRAPLRAIQGFASILLDEYGHTYDAAGRDYAHRIVAAGARMDQLIQDLLAFGRVTQADFPVATLAPENSLDAALPLFADQVRSTQAEVRIDRPMPAVRANATILEQVFGNLLSNALKFRQDAVPPRIRVWAEARERVVRLCVQDNGIGIDTRYCKRIFQMFERLHDSRKFPGTGIGLVIVRKGVERMGGRVGFQSQPGEGSCFWFELPAGE